MHKEKSNGLLLLIIGVAIGSLVTYFALAGVGGDLQGRFDSKSKISDTWPDGGPLSWFPAKAKFDAKFNEDSKLKKITVICEVNRDDTGRCLMAK